MTLFFLLSLLVLSSVHTSLAQGPPPPPVKANSETSGNDEEMIEFPDVEAQYIGGQDALSDFIYNTFIDSLGVIDKTISGKVYLYFVVEKDGSISNVVVEMGCHPLLDAEAVRLVEAMPKWIPGEVGGKSVRTRCMLPIVFTLE